MRSMTGYGRGEATAGDTKFVVELSSVNRKQIEVELKQFRVEMDDKIATAEATIHLQRRELSNLQDRRKIAEANVARSAKLRGKRTISARQLDDANDRRLSSRFDIRVRSSC